MMAMRYGLENCHNNKYFVFVDDDFFISVDNLLRFLESPSTYPDNNVQPLSYHWNHSYLYAGHAYYKPEPYRDRANKWYVSKDEYPYFNYPDFVA
uniref:Uncharacterized protein n=1 Tax=Megaselia scalaris TaxID=36166 RepID=T1GTG4_MEGSC